MAEPAANSNPERDLLPAIDRAEATLKSLAADADDGPPKIDVISTSVNEGNSGGTWAFIHVLLSKPAATDVKVNCVTQAGSAISSPDYDAASGTLTIKAGQRRFQQPTFGRLSKRWHERRSDRDYSGRRRRGHGWRCRYRT